MAKRKKKSAPRCEECGGTGLRPDENTGTAVCDCPAGQKRVDAATWG